MPAIICQYCFARFGPEELHYKCPRHSVDDPVLGPGSPLVFRPEHTGRVSEPPRQAPCPEHRLLTGQRVCPFCRRDLPFHVGRVPQRTIALAGCRGAGKTVFLWSLLYRLREQMAAEADPEAVPLFEDDRGFRGYAQLAATILYGGELPEATQAESQKFDGLEPLVVRVMPRPAGRLARAAQPLNLIFYDPAGELVESLEDVRYLRYLAHAEALIFLVDSGIGPSANDDLAAESLGHVARHCREQLGLLPDQPLPQRLALTLTKADEHLFGLAEPDRLVPPPPAGDAALATASELCTDLLRQRGADNLLNLAERSFRQVRVFAASALGKPPVEGRPDGPPQPRGVENPLLWLLRGG